MNPIAHEYQRHNPNVDMAHIKLLEQQFKVYYPSIQGALCQLIANDEETKQFSSTKSHGVVGVKILMDNVNPTLLKSNFIQHVDAFHIDAIYFDKIQSDATMTQPNIYIIGSNPKSGEFSTSLASCPSFADTTGSITYSINLTFVRHTNDPLAHTIYVNHVPGFNVYIIGRAYLFDYDIRKRLFHKENFTFQEAVQCRIEDYPNRQSYAFGLDCPVTRINSLTTSNPLLTCNGDVISIDKISICKPPYDPFSDVVGEINSTILKIGNYTLPLSYLRNLPGAYTEDATHEQFHIPPYLLGYIPIFSYANRSVNVELHNTSAKYEFTYSVYTVPSSYKSIGSVPSKLYQSINLHQNVTNPTANEIHIDANGVGLTKGFFIESDKLDDIAILSILYNGVQRLAYDATLLKHYTHPLSNNLIYIPLSLMNDYQKCDRDSYQTGVSMGRIENIQIRLIFQRDVASSRNTRAYSLCIGSLGLDQHCNVAKSQIWK